MGGTHGGFSPYPGGCCRGWVSSPVRVAWRLHRGSLGAQARIRRLRSGSELASPSEKYKAPHYSVLRSSRATKEDGAASEAACFPLLICKD